MSIILPMNTRNARSEFNANLAMAASARPVALERRRTPRPLSKPEREIRDTNRLYRFAVGCAVLAGLFPIYVVAVELLVK